MKVINTGTQDTNFIRRDDACKIFLMDEVISYFLPLFRDEIEKKKKILSNHTVDYKKLKIGVMKTKNGLIKLADAMKREKVVRDILDEIGFMQKRDVLYGSNKKEALDTIDSIRLMTVEELRTRLKALRSLVYKNVTRVQVSN